MLESDVADIRTLESPARGLAQQLDEGHGSCQLGVDRDTVGFWVVARALGLGQDSEAGLVEVAADRVAPAVEVLGHLGEVDQRPGVGAGLGNRSGGSMTSHCLSASSWRTSSMQRSLTRLWYSSSFSRTIGYPRVCGFPGVGVLDPEAITLDVGQLGEPPLQVYAVEFDDEDPASGGLAPADRLVKDPELTATPLRRQIGRRQHQQEARPRRGPAR